MSIWRQRDSLTVHLVNLTNPMMMKGPLREVMPVGPLTARMRCRPARAAKVQLLTAGTTPRVQESNARRLAVTVPSVDVHEVIAIDL